VSLRRLLDRARPEELETLEAVLGLSAEGRRGERAAAVESAIRRIGGVHCPSWRTSLRRLLEKKGYGPAGEIDVLEARLIGALVDRKALSPQAAGDYALMAPYGPPKQGLIPPEWRYEFKRNYLLRVFFFLMPLIWLRNRDEREQEKKLPAVLMALAKLREALQGRMTVAIVGPPSSGKDSALRALFGIDTGNIDPVAGATREAGVHKLSERLFVLNTPGHGDVDDGLSEETQMYLDHADLYLVVLNAEGGLQAPDRALLDTVQARSRPTLVALNKVDLLREGELPRMLAHVRERAPGLLVIPASFDPYLAPEPLGVDEVWQWLEEQAGESRESGEE
jgi:GTP-binding protein EngB required for normal cell division